jgi:hypothetical protein
MPEKRVISAVGIYFSENVKITRERKLNIKDNSLHRLLSIHRGGAEEGTKCCYQLEKQLRKQKSDEKKSTKSVCRHVKMQLARKEIQKRKEKDNKIKIMTAYLPHLKNYNLFRQKRIKNSSFIDKSVSLNFTKISHKKIFSEYGTTFSECGTLFSESGTTFSESGT